MIFFSLRPVTVETCLLFFRNSACDVLVELAVFELQWYVLKAKISLHENMLLSKDIGLGTCID